MKKISSVRKKSMSSSAIDIRRTGIFLHPNHNRVVLRSLRFSTKQEHADIIRRVLSLQQKEAESGADQVVADFSSRHRNLTERLLKRFRQLENYAPAGRPISGARKILIGSYFMYEYSAEAAALFNPSIIAHPDQSDIAPGSMRFLMTLRSTGEGHVSSISFRSGVLDDNNGIAVDPPSRFLSEPELMEAPAIGGMWRPAKSNFEISFPRDTELSERIIFPVTAAQSNGIEDVRLTAHRGEDGKTTYYGTYTAYDGRNVLPQLFVTDDFLRFKFLALSGPMIKNKGMALFPRKIGGRFAMLSRQDGENIFLMYSDDVHTWRKSQILLRPQYSWEILKLGNCGSPIETEAGWLVLSHGVGPMRRYRLGAFLLDRDDPSKVIGRLSEPLMVPEGAEREGYVPNVLYTCGSLLRNDQIILPYGMSDRAISFAVIPLRQILAAMT